MKLVDANAGDALLGFYALRRCELVPFSGGIRLDLEFGDKTGKLPGVLWGDEAEAAFAKLKGAEVVKVKGIVSSYRGSCQLKVENIRPAEADEFDITDLLPASSSSIEEIEAAIKILIESIEDNQVRQLTTAVVFDEEIKAEYFRAPGGTAWHHPYIGGLAEHSLSMAEAASQLCSHYTHLDRSLLVAGALLHDIGKIFEMEIGSTFKYSEDGRLYGHIVMGHDLVRDKARELELDQDLNVRKLLHMILSHQGKKEFAVPVEPKFEEALVLYFIDEIDSKLNAIAQIRKKPENQDQQFTRYIKLLDSHLFLKRKETVIDNEENEEE